MRPWAALARDESIFARNECLVTIRRVEALVNQGLRRQVGTPTISTLAAPTIQERLTHVARWKAVTPEGQSHPAHPPKWAVPAIMARGQWAGIRPLTGIVETPTLRWDGTILDTPGYDASTGLLYIPSLDFPPIPGSPSKEDARQAADDLLDLVTDFPFALIVREGGSDDGGSTNRAAWLAGLLTPFARFAIEGSTPFFMFDASARVPGKPSWSISSPSSSVVVKRGRWIIWPTTWR